MQRVAVVGGGLIGLSCAWHLAKAGCQVQLYDASPESREASWAAAGMLAPHHEAETDTPLWRLCAASLDRWPEFLDGLGLGPAAVNWRAEGGWIRATSSDELSRLEAQLRWLRSAGVEVNRLSPAAVNRMCPGIDPGSGALWLPGAQVDPRLVLNGLRQACVTAGVIMHAGARVERIDGCCVLLAGGTRHEHDEIVLASGAWTAALAALVGIDLPGEPVKGQLIRIVSTRELPGFVRSGHYYLLTRRGGDVVVGATMVTSGFDRSEDPVAIATLAAWAAEVMPSLRGATLRESWTGLRPRLVGGQPVIRRMRPGLVIATGHFRNGVLLTPITGELVAAAVTGQSDGWESAAE
ncbi:MAG: FAD-dependent oxidoreductase [Planctomycetota bacterium]